MHKCSAANIAMLWLSKRSGGFAWPLGPGESLHSLPAAIATVRVGVRSMVGADRPQGLLPRPEGRESCCMEQMVLDFTFHLLHPVPGGASGSGAGREFPAEPPGSQAVAAAGLDMATWLRSCCLIRLLLPRTWREAAAVVPTGEGMMASLGLGFCCSRSGSLAGPDLFWYFEEVWGHPTSSRVQEPGGCRMSQAAAICIASVP